MCPPPSDSERNAEFAAGASTLAGLGSRLVGSTGWLIGGRLIGSICTFLILFQLARRLPLGDFGRLTFYLALLAVLGCVIDLGTGQTIVQQSSAGRQDLGRLLRTGTRVRWATSVLGILAWSLWCILAGEPQAGWLIAAAVTMAAYTWELAAIPTRNAMRLRAPVLVRAGSSLLALLAVSILLRNGVVSVGPLLFAIVGSASLSNALLPFLFRSHQPAKAKQGVPLWPYLRLTLPLGLGALCQQLYFWIDNALIRHLLDEEALGLYNLPVRLFSFAILVATMAPQAALPFLSRAHEQGRLPQALHRIGLPLLCYGIFSGAVLWQIAPGLLALFGPEFPAAQTVLRTLVVGLLLVHMGSLWITGLVAAGNTRGMLFLAASGLSINLLGNWMWLPSMGIEGAAIATALTEAWVACCAGFGLFRLGVSPISEWRPRQIAILACCALIGWLAGSLGNWLLALVPA